MTQKKLGLKPNVNLIFLQHGILQPRKSQNVCFENRPQGEVLCGSTFRHFGVTSPQIHKKAGLYLLLQATKKVCQEMG